MDHTELLPTITLPSGHAVPVMHPNLSDFFSMLSLVDQQAATQKLEFFIQEFRADGSEEHLARLQILDEENIVRKDTLKDAVLDQCYWQLAQFYRKSTPSRIREAIPALTFVLEHYSRTNEPGAKPDIVPMTYLGVALSLTDGQESNALKMLIDALHCEERLPIHNELWARASLSRLYRKMNQIPEAEKQERAVRKWILSHPHGMPPSELTKAVSDDSYIGEDHILGHPDVKRLFGNMVEVSPGFVITYG